MDTIRFEKRLTISEEFADNGFTYGTEIFVATVINGRPLLDMVYDYEYERKLSHALNYEYNFAPRLYEYLTKPKSRFHNEVVLMICGGCFEEGCWPFLVRPQEADDCVIWDEFDTSYSYDLYCGGKKFGAFRFDKAEYYREAEKIKDFAATDLISVFEETTESYKRQLIVTMSGSEQKKRWVISDSVNFYIGIYWMLDENFWPVGSAETVKRQLASLGKQIMELSSSLDSPFYELLFYDLEYFETLSNESSKYEFGDDPHIGLLMDAFSLSGMSKRRWGDVFASHGLRDDSSGALKAAIPSADIELLIAIFVYCCNGTRFNEYIMDELAADGTIALLLNRMKTLSEIT
jgi:hypothetical protein